MEVYKFFNSVPGDARTYQANDFADYFGSVLSTGLLHTDNVPGMVAEVIEGTLNTSVSPGKAIMKGHLYENTTTIELTHSIPEATFDRIDRIVLRLDLRNAERNILLHVKEGAPSETPVAPELQRDNFVHEISLARVRIRANTVQLLPADLDDERFIEELCGLVHSLISIPTTQFQAEWDLFFEGQSTEVQEAASTFMQSLITDLQEFEETLETDIMDFRQRWEDWFATQQTEGFLMASERSAPGGVAGLNEEGKVINADGQLAGEVTALEFTEHIEKIASNTEFGHVKVETDEEGRVIFPVITTSDIAYSPGSKLIYQIDNLEETSSEAFVDRATLNFNGKGIFRITYRSTRHESQMYINGEPGVLRMYTGTYTEDVALRPGDVVKIKYRKSNQQSSFPAGIDSISVGVQGVIS